MYASVPFVDLAGLALGVRQNGKNSFGVRVVAAAHGQVVDAGNHGGIRRLFPRCIGPARLLQYVLPGVVALAAQDGAQNIFQIAGQVGGKLLPAGGSVLLVEHVDDRVRLAQVPLPDAELHHPGGVVAADLQIVFHQSGPLLLRQLQEGGEGVVLLQLLRVLLVVFPVLLDPLLKDLVGGPV